MIRADFPETRLDGPVEETAERLAQANPPSPIVPRPDTHRPAQRERPPASAPAGAVRSRPRRPRRLASRLFWPTVCALGAALVVLTTGNLRYTAKAHFAVDGSIESCRRRLLDFLWQREKDGLVRSDWRVTTDDDARTIDVIITATDPDPSGTEIRSLADDFTTHLRRETASANRASDTARHLVANIVDEWERELNDRARIGPGNLSRDREGAVLPDNAQPEISQGEDLATPSTADDGSPTSTDPHRPHSRIEAARIRMDALIEAYRTARDAEAETVALIDRLESSPPQPHVDPAARQAAYTAQPDVRQELAELTVQLTLGRRQLEDVWQNASPTLDELVATTARLLRAASGDDAQSAHPAHQRFVDELAARCQLYQTRLGTFAEKWTETFVRMRSEPLDPFAPRLFDAQNHLHELLAEFSFHSAKLIEDMREQVRGLTEQTDQAARNHALVSRLRRGFHELAANHRQFEFVAADVYVRNNFRLDSAVKSARGLRRRLQTATEAIDAQLQTEAVARAADEARTARRQADEKLRDIRRESDATVLTLIASITEWQSAVLAAARQQQHDLQRGWIHQRVADSHQKLAAARTLLEELDRHAAADPAACKVTLLNCEMDDTPAGLVRRFTYAAAAGLFAFISVALVAQRLNAARWP